MSLEKLKKERIYLAGFMTCGKSTIGPILANVLGWDFFDLDKVIVKKEKMEIVDIFEKKGEPYFRQIETDTLKELSTHSKVIIALGGGAMAQHENIEILKSTGLTIYLRASIDIIYKRLKNKIDRPAFRDFVLEGISVEEFKNKIAKMLKEREPFYLQADLVVNSSNKRIGLMVDDLAAKVKKIIYSKEPKANEKNSSKSA